MTSPKMASRLRTHVASAVMVFIAFAGPAAGQNYPNRPIILMVSTTAGASPDLIARLFAHKLSDGLKTPVVVENKGGANGQIATQAIADAAPDGYTFLATTGATLTINPTLYPQTAATRHDATCSGDAACASGFCHHGAPLPERTDARRADRVVQKEPR